MLGRLTGTANRSPGAGCGSSQGRCGSGVDGCGKQTEVSGLEPSAPSLATGQGTTPALTTNEIKHSLETIYAAIKTGIVTGFSCARKLTETMEATFYFDLSCRGQGQAAWEHLHKLEGDCVLQLVGLAYKRAGLRRGCMAQKLMDLLGQR